MKPVLALLTSLIITSFSNGQTIYSKAYGNKKGRPIVFIHGGPSGNSVLFEATTAKNLADKGFYLIVYDRRGEGRSIDSSARFTYNEAIDDLNTILKDYNIEKANIIGHSFGGLIATIYADKYPEKVNALILAGALFSQQETYDHIFKSVKKIYVEKGDSINLRRTNDIENLNKFSAEYRKGCYELAGENGFFDMPNVTEENQQLLKEYRESEFYIENIRNNIAPLLFYQNEPLKTINTKPILESLIKKNVQIYAIYGSQDGLFSASQMNDMKNLVKEKNFKQIENCSHYLFVDQQKEFLNTIEQWVNQTDTYSLKYPKSDYLSEIDSLVSTTNTKPFNGIILISQNGKTIYSKVIGYSDLDKKMPLQQDYQFVIGSISKQFTAVMVLQAYEKGLIKLNSTIKKYLPELTQSWADSITVHQLLTHTHGIQQLDKPLVFKAGTQFEYSQIGYNILASILERVNSKSFSDLSAELFEKCGMQNTFHPDIKKYLNLVKGYTEQDNGALAFENESFNNYAAAGSFISTAQDLDLWNQNLQGGKLLKKGTFKMMVTKQKFAIRKHPIFGLTQYGYGLTVDKKEDILQIGQTGFAPGFISMNFYFPKTQTSAIVLENVAYDTNDLKKTFYYHTEILKIIRKEIRKAKNAPY